MKHFERVFTSTHGQRIYYQVWKPDTNAKAVVNIVHGIAEHSNRYKHVAARLVEANYIVYASDLVGHGKSTGKRAYIKKFSHYLDDQLQLNTIIQQNELNVPIYFLGHSMGATIAIEYATAYGTTIKGLILSGAGNISNPGLQGPLLTLLTIFTFPISRFAIMPLKSNNISTDREQTLLYRTDPLVSKKITLKLSAELMRAFSCTLESCKQISMPILIQKGKEDEYMLGITKVIENLASKDKTIHFYDNAFHEVYNEIPSIREKVLQDLVEWLDIQVK